MNKLDDLYKETLRIKMKDEMYEWLISELHYSHDKALSIIDTAVEEEFQNKLYLQKERKLFEIRKFIQESHKTANINRISERLSNLRL